MKRKRIFVFEKWTWRFLFASFFAFLFFSLTMQAQNLTVSGTITEQGEPVPGVSVSVKGTTQGTISNVDGLYNIDANEGDVLVFSFIGMKTKERTVTGPSLDVEMESDVISLDEVVAIGYGSVSKKELTGAVAQVKSEDIANVVTSDLGNALQGQVAGVNVISSSGAPGASSEILIRGLSSISGSNQPLYVVDGVPFDGDPGLNPNEIETIDILKDAASAAIYGTRGAAGVILITTKQGEAGTLRVKANASYGIQDITSSTPLMNAAEQTYFDMVEDRNVSDAKDDLINLQLAKSPKGFLNDTELGKLVFIDNAAVQDYNVNISGGSDDISYNAMVGYHNKEGVIVNSNFERVNSRVNTTYNHGKWNIDASVGFSREVTDRAPGGIITQTIKYLPTQPSLDIDSDEPIFTQGGDQQNRLNWVVESFKNLDTNYDTKTFGNLGANYSLAKGLNLNSRLSVNYSNGYRKRFKPFQEIYDNDGELVSNPTSSFVQMNSYRQQKTDFQLGLRYNKKINDHKFTLQAVYTLEEQTMDQFLAKRYGVLDNAIDVLDGTSLNPEVGSGFNWITKQIGSLGRLLYDYKSRYMISASARYDGSSKFADSYRWGWFPSVSGAWNVSEEAFWEPLRKTVNSLKLRLGRGTVGNNRFAAYSYSAGISRGKDYAFGPDVSDVLLLGSTQSQFANAEVKWETSVQWNGGIDIAMFRNKLNFTAEIYSTQKKDMLFPVTLPGSASGSSSGQPETVTLNVGDMINEGAEFSLGYRTRFGDVKFGAAGTFSFNENEITKMVTEGDFIMTDDYGLISGARDYSQVTALAEGYEAGAFFLYTTNGVADTEEKLAEYQQLVPTARMGDLIYEDNNQDGEISNLDRVYSGSGLPEYEAGLNLNAEYKGFDLSMQWYAALGHEIMNGSRATAYGYGRHKDLIYAWSEANPITPIPAYRGDVKDHANFRGYTDQWLEDGSYLRLKTITLGYSLPKNVLERMGVSKTRIYLTAQNPLTFTNYKGFDPEVGGGITSRGLDKGNYPVTSMYVIGLNLNF